MVYVFFANGFEEIEGITPVDLLRRAEIDVTTVGVGGKVIFGAHKIAFACDMDDGQLSFENIDMIVLPGGMPGTLGLERSETVQKAIRHCVENNIPIAAICAAPSILGHLGLLKDKKAISYPGYEEELTGAQVIYENVVTDGNFITSRGPGTAIEFSLKIVEHFKGADRAKSLAEALQWAK